MRPDWLLLQADWDDNRRALGPYTDGEARLGQLEERLTGCPGE